MVDPFSPIQKFYPLNFTLDSEGKRQDWEAVVVLDFIDVPLLRMAEREVGAEQLTAEEILRNKFGPILQFQYDAGDVLHQSFTLKTLPWHSRPDEQLRYHVSFRMMVSWLGCCLKMPNLNASEIRKMPTLGGLHPGMHPRPVWIGFPDLQNQLRACSALPHCPRQSQASQEARANVQLCHRTRIFQRENKASCLDLSQEQL